MLKLDDIQSTVRSLIAQQTYFAGVSILLDEGKSDNAAEAALRTVGIVVQVMPLLGANFGALSTSTASLDVSISVRIRFNPDLTPPTGKTIAGCIRAVILSLIEYKQDPGENGFRLAEDAVLLSRYDPGDLAYDITFNKTVVL